MKLDLSTVITLIALLAAAWFGAEKRFATASEYRQHVFDSAEDRFRRDLREVRRDMEVMELEYDCLYNKEGRCYETMPPEALKRYRIYENDREYLQDNLDAMMKQKYKDKRDADSQ
jgi:hypothetical protein